MPEASTPHLLINQPLRAGLNLIVHFYAALTFALMGIKNTTPFLILFQALLMLLAGWLISKISWVGRMGINLVYKEYSIFKSWWKTALLLFFIQMVLILVQSLVHKKYSRAIANIASIALLVTAVGGLIATYSDFQNTFSHRLLKEKFHLGFYLFWIGWISTCLYYIFSPGRANEAISKANSKPLSL